MRFWMRELLGWFLVLLGLFLFYWDLSLLLDERASKYLQAAAMLPIAIFVFRGGITARIAPTRLETAVARKLRRAGIPQAARDLRNPEPSSNDILAEGRMLPVEESIELTATPARRQVDAEIERSGYPPKRVD